MKKLQKVNYDITNGSSFSSIKINANANKLLEVLGNPTVIGSEDGKVQLNWVYYNPKIGSEQAITIYDYRENVSINQIKKWHVGAKNINTEEIIAELLILGIHRDDIELN